jgi:hypothetical protein
VRAQIDRATGLAHADSGPLRKALATFAKAGARPAEARTSIELGALTEDRDLIEAGRKTLREIGDVDQADRYA